MKRRILYCEECKEDTRHLVTKKLGSKRGKFRTRRDVKHCCKCNIRNVKNHKRTRESNLDEN